MTGVTLVAFANGAPDIIFSVAAGGFEGGVSYSIGSLFGAGFFVITIVFGLVTKICEDAEV